MTPALVVINSTSAATETMETINDPSTENVRKRPLDKGNEKISPVGKSLRLKEEVSEISQPEKKNKTRDEFYEKVVDIMKGLAPMVSNEDAPIPNREAFKALYQIVVFLSHVVFEDFGSVERIVKENREIHESNQTMKYAQHCENLKKDMEKSQRTVKVLDMPVKDSITNGKIENMNTARDNVKKLLKTN